MADIAAYLVDDLLPEAPYRQWALTFPWVLRCRLAVDRPLFSKLLGAFLGTVSAWQRRRGRALGIHAGLTGSVSFVQRFGSLLNFHPHPHRLVTDGAFRPDATFLHLGYHEIVVLTEAYRRRVLREFVRLDLLTEGGALSMLLWPHGGFQVNHAIRLEADDACGILQLARSSARARVSLERWQCKARKLRVTLQSGKREGPTAGSHAFPALEFLGLLLAHIPDCRTALKRATG